MPSATTPKYVSEPILKIGGSNAPPELAKDILRIVVEESLHLPTMFMVVLHNNYIPTLQQGNAPWRHQRYLEIGKEVEIGFGSSVTADPEFQEEQRGMLVKGEITAIDVNFTDKSESHIILRGYDVSHRLHRGRFNRSFLNMSDSEIVEKIIKEVGITPGQIDSTGSRREYVFQENQTNMEFLRELAARQGFELFVQDGKLNFCKVGSRRAETLDLRWLTDISHFNVRMSSAQQVSSVEVRSWDYENKQPIVQTAQSEKVLTETDQGKGSRTATKFGSVRPKMMVVDQPVFSADEAKRIAQGLCDELGGEFICADAKAEGNGNPEIRPGKLVNLRGMNKYDGKYYITETRHVYEKKVYSTDFTVRGLRDGSMLSMLTPKTHLQPGQTLMIGIVSNNQDPKNLGRVKVKLPTLSEEHESNWARVVHLGAGGDRGYFCLPEVNYEVLVGFEHGDIHRPFIIGGVWNGKDKPPESVGDAVQGGKVRLRSIQTRTGHKIQFVEEDKGGSKKGISIQTSGGHKIKVNDSDRNIEIETSGGHKMKMDDMGRSITIKSTLNLSIEAQGNIDIKANGIITVQGSMIRLN